MTALVALLGLPELALLGFFTTGALLFRRLRSRALWMGDAISLDGAEKAARTEMAS